VEDDVEIEEIDFESIDADEDTEFDFVPIAEEEEAEDEVFFIVEDMPLFQGGPKDNFRAYIQQNLNYPPIAAENGISGRVFVQFAVNSKGEVVDVVVVRGVDPALDKEAVRVVKSSPKWTPGKQRGRPVKVQFTFPIVFVLQ
jgi:protein TonB